MLVFELEDESDLATGLLPLPRVLSLMGCEGGSGRSIASKVKWRQSSGEIGTR